MSRLENLKRQIYLPPKLLYHRAGNTVAEPTSDRHCHFTRWQVNWWFNNNDDTNKRLSQETDHIQAEKISGWGLIGQKSSELIFFS